MIKLIYARSAQTYPFINLIEWACLYVYSGIIQRASNGWNILFHYVSINLGGLYVRVTHEPLEHADIDAVFEHVRGEWVPEGVASWPFRDASTINRDLDRFL